jgi:hypothetical protein
MQKPEVDINLTILIEEDKVVNEHGETVADVRTVWKEVKYFSPWSIIMELRKC